MLSLPTVKLIDSARLLMSFSEWNLLRLQILLLGVGLDDWITDVEDVSNIQSCSDNLFSCIEIRLQCFAQWIFHWFFISSLRFVMYRWNICKHFREHLQKFIKDWLFFMSGQPDGGWPCLSRQQIGKNLIQKIMCKRCGFYDF